MTAQIGQGTAHAQEIINQQIAAASLYCAVECRQSSYA